MVVFEWYLVNYVFVIAVERILLWMCTTYFVLLFDYVSVC